MALADFSFISDPNRVFGGQNQALRLQQALMQAAQQGQQMNQRSQMFPEQLKQQQLANQIKQAQLPYAGAQSYADALYKIIMSQYLGSPGLQQKYLTQEGKTYTEPGIIRTVQAQQNANQAPYQQAQAFLSQMSGQPTPPMFAGQQGVQPQQIQTEQPQGMGSGKMSPTPLQQMSMTHNVPSMPTDSPLTPQQQINEEYNLRRLKSISDPQARQKALYALNIEKTLAKLDPDALLQFSGPQGHLELALEGSKDRAGNPSKKYTEYSKAKEAADLLAQQIRQFYGTSVKKDAMQHLLDMVNPSNFLRSPKTAKAMFNQAKDILKSELSTYRDAMNLRSTFDQPSKAQSQEPANNEKVLVINPQGQQGYIPAQNLDKALQMGYKRG